MSRSHGSASELPCVEVIRGLELTTTTRTLLHSDCEDPSVQDASAAATDHPFLGQTIAVPGHGALHAGWSCQDAWSLHNNQQETDRKRLVS